MRFVKHKKVFVLFLTLAMLVSGMSTYASDIETLGETVKKESTEQEAKKTKPAVKEAEKPEPKQAVDKVEDSAAQEAKKTEPAVKEAEKAEPKQAVDKVEDSAAQKAQQPKAADVNGSVAIDVTNFPDEKFRTYVSENFDKVKDNNLTVAEIANIREIVVSKSKITDLKGIEHFTSLYKLDCAENDIAALDVSENLELVNLQCRRNRLTTLDVSKNTKLTELDCAENNIAALDVNNNTILVSLNCDSNGLSTLDVRNNTKLTLLICRWNELTTLDVSKNPELKELQCRMNPLATLDVSNNTKLITLDCSSHGLETLDVSKNTKLKWLFCTDNYLTALDVSNNPELELFFCNDNQLWTLDVSKNIKLDQLDCSDNGLRTLDVSKNTKLSMLNCSENKLKTLDLSKNPKLTLSGAKQETSAEVGSTGSLDLSEWDSTIEDTKIKNLVGGTLNGHILSGLKEVSEVTYDYDCEKGKTLNVSIEIIHFVDVNGGTGAGNYREGDEVTITANTDPAGEEFKEWTVVSGDVILADSKSSTTTFEMPNKNVEVTATYKDSITPTPEKPTIIAGAGFVYQIENGKDMTLTCSGKLEDLTGIYVDGNLVDASNYTLKSGSTILTLNASYLDTLSVGKHTLKFQYKDNMSAATEFAIKDSIITPTPEKPTIISGAGFVYQIKNGKDMTLTCSGKLEDLTGIYVDGNLVDASNYTLKSGSTILTLNASYLDTLSVGKHTLKFQYKDNMFAATEFTIKDSIITPTPEKPTLKFQSKDNMFAATKFTISEKPGEIPVKTSPAKAGEIPVKASSPKTGDTSNIILYICLIALSGGAVGFGLKKRKSSTNLK